jgi:hypothetical protein
MPDAFVYIDESQSPDRQAAEPGVPFRVGVLILENQIADGICARALAALAADPEAAGDGRDRATLARGFFHASLDSKNAHSALCRSIVEAKLDAYFMDMQWKFDPPKVQTSSETERVGGLHSLVNMLASMSVLDDDYDFVHMEVARRAGTFDEFHAERLTALFDEERLGSVIESTAGFRARFPGFDIKVSDGSNAGVQVCDFLLWAVQRKKLLGDDPWQGRVNLRMLYEGSEVDGHQAKGHYVLGEPRDASFVPKSSHPRAPQLGSMPLPEIEQAMLEIEADIRRAHREAVRGDRRIQQHAAVLTAAVDVLDGRANASGVVDVAKAFILTADTMPLYDPKNEREATRASEKRLVSAFVLDGRFLNGVRTRDHWSRWLHKRTTRK